MGTITREGQTITFHDHGGAGPAVVFSHSFSTDGSLFAPQVAALRNHRCITWDERAHGQSPATTPFTFWDSAKDLLGILDALGIEKAALVGTSQGGFVAMRAALLAPSRVTSLAVLGTSAREEAEETRVAYTQLAEAFAAGPPEQVLDTMAAICFGPTWDASTWKARWRAWPKDQMRAAVSTLVARDRIVERLPELSVPMLVMHGTADNAYAMALGEEIAAHARDAKLVRVDGGAHFLNATHPEAVNAALVPFLER